MARPGEGRRRRGRGGAESGERCQETASPEVGEECQTVHSGPSVLLELKPLEPRMRFLFCRTITVSVTNPQPHFPFAFCVLAMKL